MENHNESRLKLESDVIKMSNKTIPKWDVLTQKLKTNSVLESHVEKIKKYCPTFKLNLSMMIMKYFFNSQFSKMLFNFSWQEMIEVLADQIVRNQALDRSYLNSPLLLPVNYNHNRRHKSQQIQYSQVTAQARANIITKMSDLDAPILILGDNELFTLELLKLGFSNVTTIDHDKAVLLTIDEKYPFKSKKLISWDLVNIPSHSHVQQNYQIVLINPANSIESIKKFLDCAERLTRYSSGTKYFLNIHILSLAKKGIVQLRKLFKNYDFEVEDIYQGFNIYPIPQFLKTFIALFNRFLISSKTLGTQGYSFSYFLTDTVLLQKQIH